MNSWPPFLFVPIPQFFFDPHIFEDRDFFHFLCFAMSRTYNYETAQSFCFHGQTVTLEMGEFIFGRSHWAKKLNVSENVIRSLIHRLTHQQFAGKITSKSTNKLSVYKWSWTRFPDFKRRQNNQQSASKTPANPPQTKKENIEKEKQQQEVNQAQQGSSASIVQPVAAAAFPRMLGKAKKLLNALPLEKREAVIALLYKRAEIQPIENPDAWIIKCIENDWIAEAKMELPERQALPSDSEINRLFASAIIQKYEGLPSLHFCLRLDFLELGNVKGQTWQFFFCEPSEVFQKQVAFALQKLGYEI